jgi:hypothetical protein
MTALQLLTANPAHGVVMWLASLKAVVQPAADAYTGDSTISRGVGDMQLRSRGGNFFTGSSRLPQWCLVPQRTHSVLSPTALLWGILLNGEM